MPEAVQCRRCYHLRNDWCKIKRDSPDPELVRTCPYYHEATNADRIRAMTDEELAEFISSTDFCELLCNDSPVCIDGQCFARLFNWLKQEVSNAD